VDINSSTDCQPSLSGKYPLIREDPMGAFHNPISPEIYEVLIRIRWDLERSRNGYREINMHLCMCMALKSMGLRARNYMILLRVRSWLMTTPSSLQHQRTNKPTTTTKKRKRKTRSTFQTSVLLRLLDITSYSFIANRTVGWRFRTVQACPSCSFEHIIINQSQTINSHDVFDGKIPIRRQEGQSAQHLSRPWRSSSKDTSELLILSPLLLNSIFFKVGVQATAFSRDVATMASDGGRQLVTEFKLESEVLI
jgi:hypothetical protein